MAEMARELRASEKWWGHGGERRCSRDRITCHSLVQSQSRSSPAGRGGLWRSCNKVSLEFLDKVKSLEQRLWWCMFGFKHKLVTPKLFCNCSNSGLRVSLARDSAMWGQAGFAPGCLTLCEGWELDEDRWYWCTFYCKSVQPQTSSNGQDSWAILLGLVFIY